VELAEANPSVEFVVEARWNKRPTIYAEYRTNIIHITRIICVSSWWDEEGCIGAQEEHRRDHGGVRGPP
jgi:hypothetical protein